ncbi:MAG: putative O-glycosylation ligase, exosortase A system-associated [Rhodospirillales bacterium]|nr:MAG: putative O-glycosylation ligase, exosortase A system-associated [Rhodospirillales bacterium]
MRSLVILGVVGLLGFLALSYPIAGLYAWGWLNMMQPHQETWGLGSARLIFVMSLVTLGAWLISKEPKTFPPTAANILLVVFTFWVIVSQIFSLVPDHSFPMTDRFVRVLIFVILCAILLTSKVRIHALIWILCISIGYFGVKGGVFTILSGGAYHVWGPTGTVISDNNHLGAALAFILPLLNYLRIQTENRWIRLGLLAAMVLVFFSVLGSQSRTAFLAVFAGLALMWWRSRHRAVLIAALLPVAIVGVTFMPDSWHERMQTIKTAEEDASFMGRVDAWVIATEVAKGNPITGGGLRVFYRQDIADAYLLEPRESRAAHSIYFEILGGMGFVGFALFMALITLAILDSFWIRRNARSLPEYRWAWDFASMAQVSLVIYGIGGAALSLEMWQGSWLLFMLLSRVRWQMATEMAATRPAGSRFRKRPAGAAAPTSNAVPRSSQPTSGKPLS